jgi:glycine dehydrogenase subunit 1
MYISNDDKARSQMLSDIGVSSEADLFKNIPENLKFKEISLGDGRLSGGMTELDLLNAFRQIAAKNKPLNALACFKGAGVYDHYVPSLVGEVVGRSEFLTAYTPYQAEASQGTLQAIFEYQSLICALTAMDVSNACLYDGATAVAEAALLAVRASGKNTVLISKALNPEYLKVTKTYLQNTPVKIVEVDVDENGQTVKPDVNDNAACFIAQSPNYFGVIENMEHLKKATSGLFIAVVNPISLGLLKPPGEYGADIAVGEGQPLGCGAQMGGATFGFMAVKKGLEWKMPGRIVGQTSDTDGKRGFVLTLQSREQHIRRERATSNICTNAALNALAGAVYLSYFNDKSFKHLAGVNVSKARYLAAQISKIDGYKLKYPNSPFFNEFVVETAQDISKINKMLLKHAILGPAALGKRMCCFCVTEKNTKEQMDLLVNLLGKYNG